MSSASSIIGPILTIAAKVAKWIDQGLSNEEIRKRLANPNHVGDDLLDGIRERKQIGKKLLGRDPR